MDVITFWQLIEKTRAAGDGNIRKQVKLMFEELISLSVEEILALESIMYDLKDNAYQADLWDAASIINCGCSDDGFEDFRGWLIAQGKEVYEKAIIDQESLIDVVEVNEMAEDNFILYIFTKAYGYKTRLKKQIKYRKQPLLMDVTWEEEKKKLRFPKLAAKFGDCDQRESIWDAEEIKPPVDS